MRACACMRVCVCVTQREREREREHLCLCPFASVCKHESVYVLKHKFVFSKTLLFKHFHTIPKSQSHILQFKPEETKFKQTKNQKHRQPPTPHPTKQQTPPPQTITRRRNEQTIRQKIQNNKNQRLHITAGIAQENVHWYNFFAHEKQKYNIPFSSQNVERHDSKEILSTNS